MPLTLGVVLKPGVAEGLYGVEAILRQFPDAVVLAEKSGHHAIDDLPPAVERVDERAFEERSDLVVVFGGDGTLIHAASLLPNRVVPILGINLGRIGFMTEIPFEELHRSLALAATGQLPHSDRMRLDAELWRGGEVLHRQRVLNDVALARETLSRIATFRVTQGERLITAIRGDGVIVATPTGSTAYGMAAGGPILSPDLEAIAVTPICPYQLNQRPLVIKPRDELRLTATESERPVSATFDGRGGEPMREGDELRIRRAPVGTRLLSVPWRDYFEMLRVKLRWGGDR